MKHQLDAPSVLSYLHEGSFTSVVFFIATNIAFGYIDAFLSFSSYLISCVVNEEVTGSEVW